MADRGIGGTGAPANPPTAVSVADRGIGGTGIVGVITGFGSVFVNGVEIGYHANARVDIDGSPGSTLSLRAGQMVAIQAGTAPDSLPTQNALQASAISVWSAVVGVIETLEPASGTLTIAGQTVSVPRGTWGADRLAVGDWVRVSGLRKPDGTILASRLDAAPADVLLVRGRIVRDAEGARVGSLALAQPIVETLRDGQFVVVSGDYTAGQRHVTAVAPDPLLADPGEYFGASASQLIVQAFVQVDNGTISMNGMKLSVTPVVSATARHDGMAIVSLGRETDGSYIAIGLRYTDYRGHTEPSSLGGNAGADNGCPTPWQDRDRPVPLDDSSICSMPYRSYSGYDVRRALLAKTEQQSLPQSAASR